MQTINIENINSSYGKKEILKNVSFFAEQGECIGILGFNGCGKSTLLSILAGVQKPKNGKITYCEKIAYSKEENKYNKKLFDTMIGYVPQENPLIPELSVYDNLSLWFENKKTLDESLKNGFLHTLGIHEYSKKKVNQLSGGMKKRVSIAIATIYNPPILILDEPSAALDLSCKEDIKDYLKNYLEQGKNVIITTHEDNELELCDKIYVLKNGVLKEVNNKLRGKELVKEF